jgi:hypothetical protein
VCLRRDLLCLASARFDYARVMCVRQRSAALIGCSMPRTAADPQRFCAPYALPLRFVRHARTLARLEATLSEGATGHAEVCHRRRSALFLLMLAAFCACLLGRNAAEQEGAAPPRSHLVRQLASGRNARAPLGGCTASTSRRRNERRERSRGSARRSNEETGAGTRRSEGAAGRRRAPRITARGGTSEAAGRPSRCSHDSSERHLGVRAVKLLRSCFPDVASRRQPAARLRAWPGALRSRRCPCARSYRDRSACAGRTERGSSAPPPAGSIPAPSSSLVWSCASIAWPPVCARYSVLECERQ